MVEVRPAVVKDAMRIGKIHVSSWQATYVGVFPREFLEGLSVSSRQVWWTQRLSRPINRADVLVVEIRDEVVGFASVGPSGETEGEVYAIYLAPEMFRLGLGRELMEASETRLATAGFEEAILWVVEANQRARSFYEAMGWKPDGALKLEEIGGVQVRELRYRKRLSVPKPASSPVSE
jgi:ribosomal protein S18 acetylase RimI-like enzyme